MKHARVIAAAVLILASTPIFADELVQMIQQDLQTLGYDPGNTDGEPSVQTTVAISAFQSENDLEVTGEATPQLAGILQARVKQESAGSRERSQEDLEAARKACIEEKIAERRQKEKTKRGIGGLLRAASRTTGMAGAGGTAADISRTASVLYGANATASDVSQAARDLGLSEDEIEACRNPE